jgi:hypothetical protein
MTPSRKVYIVNRSAHDFSRAKDFGELVYLSSGEINRWNTNHMARIFEEVLASSSKEDYLVLCSLNIMNSIASAIFSHLHGRLNILLYKDGRYIERNLVFGQISNLIDKPS